MPWHLIQRGHNRGPCFVDDADRDLYLGLLAELSAADGCAVHAYVLMTNHVHLLVTPDGCDSVSRFMKHLGERYVRWFNDRHSRRGSLWSGRFRSCLVDSDAYLMTCQRYIELNPVRAGMVAHPREYRWSSYLTNAEGLPSLFIRPHSLMEAFGGSEAARHRGYRDAFPAAFPGSELELVRKSINSGLPLARPEFLKSLEKQLRKRMTPRPSGRPRKDTDRVVESVLW